MTCRCLFHLHTRHSFDSLLSPGRIVAYARELKANVLIVTDHNTIAGSLDAKDAARGNPMVVIAAEYQSEKGDIIGLFLKEEVRSRDSKEIIQQIRAQDGLVVLPHPYKAHILDDELLAAMDLIEVYNSRCSPEENQQAMALAARWNLPTIAGADAHCFSELGAVVNEFSASAPSSQAELQKMLLNAPRTEVTRPTSPLCRPYSQMVKAMKTKNPNLFLYQAKRFVLTLARGAK